MLDRFEFWSFFAGLGIFLFGILTLEGSVKGLAGRAFKKIVRRYTKTRTSAIATGIFATSILQSSSAISMISLAFVGAGILSLENAIGVIIGSNIGTTVTAWIVAFFGFKVGVESFALPLIGIGGLGLIFTTSGSKYFHLGTLLIGFGFMFLGLDYMKVSVEEVTGAVNLSGLAGLGYPVFVLAGLILTALMQSSSATIAIVLTAINGSVIPFGSGAAMVIGANIGTTITVLLGAVGGVPIKKRAAASHLMFNLLTGLVAILLLPALIWIIEIGFGWQGQPVLGIALFHTIFNLLGLFIFMPFIPRLTSVLDRFISEPTRLPTVFIQNTSPEVTEAALAAFNKEILHQYLESRDYLVVHFDLNRERLPDHKEELLPEDRLQVPSDNPYEKIKELHGELFEYYARIQSGKLSEPESKELDLYLRASRSFMNAVKNLRGVRADMDEFEGSENDFLNGQVSPFKERLEMLLVQLDPVLVGNIDKDQNIDSARNVLDEAFDTVEDNDATYIRGCSEAINRNRLTDLQVTSLLMANRLFTQSCRMIVLSLRALLLKGGDGPEAEGRPG